MHYRSEMSPHPSDKTWDIVVIGSGLGGMTTACLLAKAGKSVLLLERHTVPGGFTHTFKRKGYEWDVGVHYVGQVAQEKSITRRVFDYITDKKLEWAEMDDVYDEVVIGDDHYQYVKGLEAQTNSLIKSFPDEADAIRAYMSLVQSTARKGAWFFGEKTMPHWLSRFVGWMLRRSFEKSAALITRDVINKITTNEKLKAVLTAQCGNYGLEPAKSSFAIHSVVVDHYIGGASYPVGGASEIPKTIMAEFTKNGGELLTNVEVSNIVVENARAVGVKLEDGKVVRAKNIVSNAGYANTFGRLLQKSQGAPIAPSTAHLCLYVGLDQGDEALKLPKNNIWVYPNYDFDKNISGFREDTDREFPVVYISFPSAKDPRRNPNKATIQVIAPLAFDAVKEWSSTDHGKRGDQYLALKEKFANRLTEALLKAVPQIRGHIAYSELSTPLSTRDYSGYQSGEIYGLEHTPERFAFRQLRPQTKLPGLFLTGQDIVTVGVAGALYSGVLTATTILKKSVILRIFMNKPLS